MKIKIGLILMGLFFLQGEGMSQGEGGYFYDTLTIMDYTTNNESERLSRMKKPITRNFFLKSDKVSYSLFKNQKASLTADQVFTILSEGLSLYIDKMEHKGHKNLKPSMIDILDEDGGVVESIELTKKNGSLIKRKVVKGAIVRFSGFTISVNEKKHGPIVMEAKIVE